MLISMPGRKRWLLAASVAALLALVCVSLLWVFTSRVRGHTFSNGEVTLHYTEEGEGTPVVLLPGFAVNADLNWRWPGLTKTLSEEYRVIALDLRGHGLSSKPHESDRYGMAMATDVLALLDHLRVERVHLVGYSLGGFIALKLATTHPERFISISAMGAGWESPTDSAFLVKMEAIADALDSGSGVPPLGANFSGEREQPTLMHTLWVRMVTKYFNDGQALAAMVRGLDGLAVQENEMRSIPMPVCSIIGELDPLKNGVDAMVGKVPNHTVVIVEKSDHVRAVGSPILIAGLQKFLRANPK